MTFEESGAILDFITRSSFTESQRLAGTAGEAIRQGQISAMLDFCQRMRCEPHRVPIPFGDDHCTVRTRFRALMQSQFGLFIIELPSITHEEAERYAERYGWPASAIIMGVNEEMS